MAQLQLRFERGQHVFVAGQTGSGKTFFEQHVLARVPRLVALDPKGYLSKEADPTWHLTDWSERGRKMLLEGKPCRLRVPYPTDTDDWEPYIADVFKAGNVVLYIDEMYGVVEPGKRPPKSLIACWTRGRQPGISVHSVTQRPAWVPMFAMSEATWFFCFRLMLEEDKRRLAAFMGPSVMQTIGDDYGFLTYNPRWPGSKYTPQLTIRRSSNRA